VPSSGAVQFPTSFGIRGLVQRRGSTFLPVSKTFSTKRFPRNSEYVIREYRDKGECAEGWGSSKYDFSTVEKDKSSSKRGAFFYKFDDVNYQKLHKSGYDFEVT